MALNRTTAQQETNSNVEYSNLAVGEHEGRLVYVADLGMQERSFKGEEKAPAQQLSLGIEIMGNPVNVDGTMRPRLLWSRPFNVFQTLNERGIEYQMYKAFNTSAQEGTVADWDAVLGTPVSVLVKHRVAGDRTYDDIDSLSPIPARFHDSVAAGEFTDSSVGDCEDESNPAQRAMFGLPKYVFDRRIKPGQQSTKPKAVAEEDDSFDEDLPF
jgi:hypothetical protein